MSLLYLGIVFLVMVLLLAMRRPLYQAISGALLMTVLLYRIPLLTALSEVGQVLSHWSSLSVLITLYLITYLQRMLEARSQIKLAQQDLNSLFHNRKINVVGACLFIGLLPSAAAMILCGDIVSESAGDYLNQQEKAFVTSWFRHIPESTLPTYSGVLLMSTLSGVPIKEFMPGMLLPMLVLGILGYFPYLHRLPSDTGTAKSKNLFKDALSLLGHLWSLLLILILILICGLSVVPAVALSITAAALVYRFRTKELIHMLRSAFEVKLLLNTFLVLVLKEFIGCTGVLEELPALLSKLPVPSYLVFAILFFVGGVVSGTNGIVALGTPLAFAAIDGGMPLMVLLMCMCHAAGQISPTHVCLVVASDYYKITMGELVRKTLPVALLFCLLMLGYYNLLLLL